MARNLQGLPRGGSSNQGRSPDLLPEYASAVAMGWYEKYLDAGKDELAMAIEGARYRASWAHSCLRELQYRITKTEETDPASVADAWRFDVGHAVHDMVQDGVEAAFPTARREVKVDLRELGIPGAAHLDLLVEDDDGIKTAVEIKSINGFGFKKAATNFDGPPEGPRKSAVTQGALSALALDCDRLKIMYFSLELLSPSVAAKAGLNGEVGRFVAEWTYERAEFEPIALAEVERVKGVLHHIALRQLAPRWEPEMPLDARITDVTKGSWYEVDEQGLVVGSGRTWKCDYCSYRTRCGEED